MPRETQYRKVYNYNGEKTHKVDQYQGMQQQGMQQQGMQQQGMQQQGMQQPGMQQQGMQQQGMQQLSQIPKNAQQGMIMGMQHDNIAEPLKNVKQLKKALKKHRVVVVDVWAEWCQPCVMLKPKFEEIARKYKDSKFFKFFTDDIDVDTSVHKDKVTAVPTFFVYTDGNLQPRKEFQGDLDKLEMLINRLAHRLHTGEI